MVEKLNSTETIAALSVEKESLIIDAARRRFAVFGLNKVTMDEIAADIGMSKASLYYYFPTKEALFKAVIQYGQQVFLSRVDAILQMRLSASERLKRYAKLRFEYFVDPVNLQLLNAQPWLSSRPVVRDLFESLAAEELKRLVEIMKDGQKSGEFGAHAALESARVFLHALKGLGLCALRPMQFRRESAGDLQKLADEMELLAQLFLSGLRKPKLNRHKRMIHG
jgi:TetR/AcrR family transcriptional regulator